jgi:tetratricopeptide (TPR) repeat protein
MKKTILLLLITAFAVTLTNAQSNDELYNKAHKLKLEYKYKEALPMFQQLLKADSNNVEYLTDASYLYSKYGYYYITAEAEKSTYYKTAERLALKAIKLNEKSADAHYVYAMALGRINENASSKQKIANAKLIKAQVDRAIELNPKLAGAHHILGRWHRTIANFSTFEKVMINSLFGGVPPGGSHEDAIKSFKTAITLEPAFLMHQYELAQTYYDMDRKAEAKVWAQQVIGATARNEDDNKAKKECEELMKKLK